MNFPFLNPAFLFLGLPALIVAVTVHEFSHAYAATKLGDPTPKLQGRLTLNPLAHLDPLGTLMLLVARFGWGKPVQFDPYNLRNPRRDAAIISLAGPFSNIVLATFLAIILRLISSPLSLASTVLQVMIELNVVLALFNLIPMHPLDGGKILVGILPHKDALEADRFMNRYGIFILFLLIFPLWGGVSPVLSVLSPLINLVLSLLIPGTSIT